jgi:hypothetical protein
MDEFVGIEKMLPALAEEDVDRLLAFLGEVDDLGERLDALMDYIEAERPDLRTIIAAIARSYQDENPRAVEDVTMAVLTFLLFMDRAWAEMYGDAWPVH